MRPTIAVTDATGLLGGAVARAILNDPQHGCRLRALVCDTAAPAAQLLAAAGAEIVRTNFDDATSILRGFRGAAGAFAVTDFWDHGSPEREMAQARAMATAARLADVEHVIWSTQDDTRLRIGSDDDRFPTLLQRYKVPPFDAKGESDAFFAASGVSVTYLYTAPTWEQLVPFGLAPRRGADGVLRLALPLGDGAVPWIAAADVGACVVRLFAGGTPTGGVRVALASQLLTGLQLTDAFARALGECVRYEQIAAPALRGRALPGSEEVASVLQFLHDVGAAYSAPAVVEATRAMYPALQTIDRWLATHRAEIPAV